MNKDKQTEEMSYKRLTKRIKPECLKNVPKLYKEYAVTIKNEMIAFEKCFDNKDIYEDYRASLDRLCELEDMIESGTLRKASDVAREIFAEIERALNLSKCYGDSGIYFEKDIETDIAELKKKYESEGEG